MSVNEYEQRADDNERKLERCRSKYFGLEWRFNELKKIVRGIFESHNLKRVVDART